MTELDIARNAAALRNLAARLERMGYQGDTYAEAEHIAMNLLADGFRKVEPVPPLAGSTSTAEARIAALKAAEAAVRASKDKRKKPIEGDPA